jgi:hypothetical protein
MLAMKKIHHYIFAHFVDFLFRASFYSHFYITNTLKGRLFYQNSGKLSPNRNFKT